MIDIIKSYHKTKSEYQLFITERDVFEDVKRLTNLKTGEVNYPITAYQNGVSVLIDKYRAFIIGYLKNIHRCISKGYMHQFENLTFSDSLRAIKNLKSYMIDSGETKISKISYGFSVPTKKAGKDLIKMNILMHKLNYYNHNKKKKKNIELKEFEYTNYTIGIYASKKKLGLENFLSINLTLSKSLELRKMGILNVNDLEKKEKLKLLFDFFMLRFNEIIIVDNYENVKGKDKLSLEKYLSNRYWESFNTQNGRKAKYREKTKFNALILKYNLNKEKLNLESELRKAFSVFISN
ncbi:hypothetical protein DVK85_04415 [Flavobacterium arcticum]|uniref:Uncharacterized protein n=1 Tax=Flavobacterium arcticum TaxID=1784713 RepID=A0A345HAA5_9FLAO|nr:hypothetical protein [Flavobacterium arcticum]AXG73515.1 hypothetical protein DVK85_04415 [Flavobacterium arcticum]KAF2513305.1 hypothetical protein E0W72_02470 [Flavobacterium arcticum]